MEKSHLKFQLLFMLTSSVCLKKMHSCQNNLEKSCTKEKTKHTPSGYSLFTNCSFDSAENKLDCYKGDVTIVTKLDCMESFGKDLKEYAMKTVNCEKKEMIQLPDEENKSNDEQKVCYICKTEFSDDDDDDDDDDDRKKSKRDHCHYTGKF